MWLPERDVGYYPVTEFPYDDAYFEKYQGYAATEMGKAINDARVAMVDRHWQGRLLDIGIGCGQFAQSRPLTHGYDVNPAGVLWLDEQRLYLDPRVHGVDAACFWDSLEHIRDPGALLAKVRRMVFVALPIFRDLTHLMSSKHLRRDEHYWYFTDAGFRAFMAAHGWRCIEHNAVETELGREDICSYAFERITEAA